MAAETRRPTRKRFKASIVASDVYVFNIQHSRIGKPRFTSRWRCYWKWCVNVINRFKTLCKLYDFYLHYFKFPIILGYPSNMTKRGIVNKPVNKRPCCGTLRTGNYWSDHQSLLFWTTKTNEKTREGTHMYRDNTRKNPGIGLNILNLNSGTMISESAHCPPTVSTPQLCDPI